MISEPVLNDPKKPLISLLIYNYFGKELKNCFDSIFTQSALDNFEVIFCDDASSDGSWEIAVEYARRYDGIITITRNKCVAGPLFNKSQCLRKSRGKYFVPLYFDQPLLPEYVKQSVKEMEVNPFVDYKGIFRATDAQNVNYKILVGVDDDSDLYEENKPLVSVCIYNYNYGHYLRQCLDSVFVQIYDNFEVCFSDNASTDNSWDIALEYMSKYPGIMNITRNRKNFGPSSNLENCYLGMRGKYVLKLCSDDALMPGFLRNCVHALETNPDAGFAMVHRAIIDEHGTRRDEPSFYNQSCVIPGNEQAAVYMMSSVNPSISQVMYHWKKTREKRIVGSLTDRWYGDLIMDFNICCEFSMVYINEPLLLHRVHSQSDGAGIDTNLMQCVGQYVLLHQFADIAAAYDNSKVVARLPDSIKKLSRLCLRYCIRFLSANDEVSALRYFHLALAIMPEITADPVFEAIQTYWMATDSTKKNEIIDGFKLTENLASRSISYDPPPGSIPLDFYFV